MVHIVYSMMYEAWSARHRGQVRRQPPCIQALPRRPHWTEGLESGLQAMAYGKERVAIPHDQRAEGQSVARQAAERETLRHLAIADWPVKNQARDERKGEDRDRQGDSAQRRCKKYY